MIGVEFQWPESSKGKKGCNIFRTGLALKRSKLTGETMDDDPEGAIFEPISAETELS